METFVSQVSNYFTTPVQIGILLVVVLVLVKKFILSKSSEKEEETEKENQLPPMEKRDFTLEELRPYNGKDNARILVAVNGKVFDVTSGRSFYGPGMWF